MDLTGASQNNPANPPRELHPFDTPGEGSDPAAPQRQEKQENKLNAYRQEQLVRDTDRLLALAKDLKVAVDRSDKNTLSLDVVKRASEIE